MNDEVIDPPGVTPGWLVVWSGKPGPALDDGSATYVQVDIEPQPITVTDSEEKR
jgi:hypothetical protein